MCGWPSSTVTIGSGSGNSSSRIQESPSASPARAWKARNSRSALVMQTTSAPSSSAASTASGTSAPITAIVTREPSRSR